MKERNIYKDIVDTYVIIPNFCCKNGKIILNRQMLVMFWRHVSSIGRFWCQVINARFTSGITDYIQV